MQTSQSAAVRGGPRGRLTSWLVSPCCRAGECRRQSHPAVPAAGPPADGSADLGQARRVAPPRPAGPAGAPCGPRVRSPLAVEGGVDGSASRGGRAGEPEGRPRMSGPEGVAACVWPEVGAGWLICVQPACVGGRPRSEAQPLAAAAERAGLWKGLQESRGPLSRPCVTDLRHSVPGYA